MRLHNPDPQGPSRQPASLRHPSTRDERKETLVRRIASEWLNGVFSTEQCQDQERRAEAQDADNATTPPLTPQGRNKYGPLLRRIKPMRRTKASVKPSCMTGRFDGNGARYKRQEDQEVNRPVTSNQQQEGGACCYHSCTGSRGAGPLMGPWQARGNRNWRGQQHARARNAEVEDTEAGDTKTEELSTAGKSAAVQPKRRRKLKAS